MKAYRSTIEAAGTRTQTSLGEPCVALSSPSAPSGVFNRAVQWPNAPEVSAKRVRPAHGLVNTTPLSGLAVVWRSSVHLIMVVGVLTSCERSTPGPSTNRHEERPRLAPNAPVDRIVVGSDPRSSPEYQRLVREARSQLPSVRTRFLAGLPAGHHLFVTAILRSDHQVEQVFVAVRDWSNPNVVDGLLSSTPQTVGFREGDLLHVQRSEILDWTISRPDGTEEGNIVGNFIDRSQ
jgi:hypothetical protein